MLSPRSNILESFTDNIRIPTSTNKILKLASGRVRTSISSSSALLKGLRLSAKPRQSLALKTGRSIKRSYSEIEEEEVSPRGIFDGKIFVVEFSFSVASSRKTALKDDIKRNGGTISYVLNKTVDVVVASDKGCAEENYKCKKAQQLGIPLVSVAYITDSISQGSCGDYDDYRICGLKRVDQLESGKISAPGKKTATRVSLPSSVDWRSFPCHVDGRHTGYIDKSDLYRVPKWSFLTSKEGGLCVLEIHVTQTTGDKKSEYKVIALNYTKLANENATIELREADGPFQAELLFASLHSYYVSSLRYTRLDYIPFQRGSPKVIQNLFSWAMTNARMSYPVRCLVNAVWNEAVGEMEKNLSVSVNNLSKAVVEQAEGILIEMKENVKAGTDNSELIEEFYNTLPYKMEQRSDLSTLKSITKQFNMIQLLYDLLSVGEASDWNLQPTAQTKLRSLNCHVTDCDNEHWPELIDNICSSKDDISIHNFFTVTRPTEHLSRDGKERKLLFHASNPENYLGILSRGLLLPKHVVNDLGGKRTDAGNLGHGMYFADDFSTSHEYSSCLSDNTRLMLVCEVVTGNTYSTTSRMPHLTQPPSGYDSVKAEGASDGVSSQFKSNEYCVYSTSQQALKYIVRYSTKEDRAKVVEKPHLWAVDDCEEDVVVETKSQPITDDLGDIKLAEVLPGLQVEGKDQVPIPLTALEIAAKVVDLAAEVTVLQQYVNSSNEAIEAKFVFPLSEMAAVCGFEAFINDKHIVGEVKEKEQAKREYRKAVSEGHGAYLMVQDKERPDVFTVSVGNLPPKCTVRIKIIYVCELSVRDEKFVFELPTNIAPWNSKQALAEATQSTLEKVGLDSSSIQDIQCGVEVSVQMPFDIREICSPTHPVHIKKTATQAMVRMKDNQSLADGFTLTISLAEIHVPRMIIENHPELPESEQACMLTFYPEFDCTAQDNYETIVMLDLSNSMAADDITSSKKIAVRLLNSLSKHSSFNLITFGSTYNELFHKSMPANKTNIKQAVSYIQASKCRQGNTDLLTPLTNLAMLTDTCRHRNVLVISDGHMSHARETLQAVSSMYGTIRLFTMAVSSNANKFIMRELARVGSGTMEYMNSSSKSKWPRQIRGIVDKAGQPLLSQVKVIWQEQNTDMPTPVQAPACIPSIFNGNRIVVYGFASNCFMATLKAVIDGREVSTVVSASPITASTGLTVHRLAARSVIQDWEHGCLSTDSVQHESLKKKQKSSIIAMSKEYSIITQFTSFVAVEKRDKDEQFLPSKGPSMKKLMNELNLDLLPYIRYDTQEPLNEFMAFEVRCDESLSESEQLYDSLMAASDEMEEEDMCYGGAVAEDEELDQSSEVWGESSNRSHDGSGSSSEESNGSSSSDSSSNSSSDSSSDSGSNVRAFCERSLPARRVTHSLRGRVPAKLRGASHEVVEYASISAPVPSKRADESVAEAKAKAMTVDLCMEDSLMAASDEMEEEDMFYDDVVTAENVADERPDKLTASSPSYSPTSPQLAQLETRRFNAAMESDSIPWQTNELSATRTKSQDTTRESQTASEKDTTLLAPLFHSVAATSGQSLSSPGYAGFGSTGHGAEFGSTARGVGFGSTGHGVEFGSTAHGVGFGSTGHGVGFGSTGHGVGFGSTAHYAGFGSRDPLPSANPFDSTTPAQGFSLHLAQAASTPASTFNNAASRATFGSSTPAAGSLFGARPNLPAYPIGSSSVQSAAPPLPPRASHMRSMAIPLSAKAAPPPGGVIDFAQLPMAPRPFGAAPAQQQPQQPQQQQPQQPQQQQQQVYRSHTRTASALKSMAIPPPPAMLQPVCRATPQDYSTEQPDYIERCSNLQHSFPAPLRRSGQLMERSGHLKKRSSVMLRGSTGQHSLGEEQVRREPMLAEYMLCRKSTSRVEVTDKKDTLQKMDESVEEVPLPKKMTMAKPRRSLMSRRAVKCSMQIEEPTEVNLVPGIYCVVAGKEPSLRIDYSSLTNLSWNVALHLIDTVQAVDSQMSPKLYQKSHARAAEIEVMIGEITKNVPAFSYFALERLLISSGVMSLGKTAACDIVNLFLWKILTFVQHVRYLFDTRSSMDQVDVQELVQLVDKPATPPASSPYYLWLRQYPNICRRLELGSRWSHVLINMMCDPVKRHLMWSESIKRQTVV